MPTIMTETMLSSANDQPVYFSKPQFRDGYLNQWYASEFEYNRDTYSSNEQWMMVQKARLFGDEVSNRL
jgi:predicted NAD-dependent protein-ADP-ribosyltransferase YbiA (DUF1768 family)